MCWKAKKNTFLKGYCTAIKLVRFQDEYDQKISQIPIHIEKGVAKIN